MHRQRVITTLTAGALAAVLVSGGPADSQPSADEQDARDDAGYKAQLVSSVRALDLSRARSFPRSWQTTTTTTPPPPPPPTTTTVPPTTTTTTEPPPPPPEPDPPDAARPQSGAEIVCPVDGAVNFVDTWGAARSGGRVHQGTDMMAGYGTPTVAPVSGQVEHRTVSGGGVSWFVHGDDGNTYFGTHLSGYESEGSGWVEAGTVIGYVGDSGNAAGTPHLHFEFHPGGGSPVNPYNLVAAAC
jgi:murein DD-endopeptidase MepM/ murein hydrolase activator NlpD